MMTKKTMAILSVFMVVALTAVGFAAWLIVGSIEGEATGSFVSNELQDKYFKVDVKFVTSDSDKDNGTIRFGAPSAEASSTGWLTHAAKEQEKLTATATITFTPDEGFDGTTKTMDYYLGNADGTQRKIKVAINIVSLDSEGAIVNNAEYAELFDLAVEAGYITYPTVKCGATEFTWSKDSEGKEINNFQNGTLYLELDAKAFTVSTDKKFATANISFEFKWGNVTGNQNPYKFFNGKEPQTAVETVTKLLEAAEDGSYSLVAPVNPVTYKDLAANMLSYLKDCLNTTTETGIRFSITLSEGTAA